MIISPSMVFGAASAIQGLMGTFGAYNQQTAQTKAENERRLQQFEYQKKQIELENTNRRNLYAREIRDYNLGMLEDERAESRGLAAIQRGYDEARGEAAIAREQLNLQQQQALGSLAARGVAGGSAARGAVSAIAETGRRERNIEDNLLRARYAAFGIGGAAESLRDQRISSMRQRYGKVEIAPTMAFAPPAPIMQSGPSRLSLMANVGGNVLGGIQSGISMKQTLGANDNWKSLFS